MKTAANWLDTTAYTIGMTLTSLDNVIKWVSSSHTETDRHAHTQKFPQALATKEWKKDTISQKREHMDSKLEEDCERTEKGSAQSPEFHPRNPH